MLHQQSAKTYPNADGGQNYAVSIFPPWLRDGNRERKPKISNQITLRVNVNLLHRTPSVNNTKATESTLQGHPEHHCAEAPNGAGEGAGVING